MVVKLVLALWFGALLLTTPPALTGTVRDAATAQPLRATVEAKALFGAPGCARATTTSDPLTGGYTLPLSDCLVDADLVEVFVRAAYYTPQVRHLPGWELDDAPQDFNLVRRTTPTYLPLLNR